VIANRPPSARPRAGEGGSGNERAAEGLRLALNPHDFVYRRTDQRELQALRYPDISLNDFAEVECDTEVEN